MDYWFTSDTHFGHFNIIKYCNRPFKTLEDMDNTLIRNINERVKEDDTLFFLGDFCFKKSKEAPEGNIFSYYRNKINCKNIAFIKGNHDRNNSTKTIIESLVIRCGGKWVKLVHSPDSQYIDTKYDLIFCGHVHQNWKFKTIKGTCKNIDLINLSVDVWDFYPRNFNEIIKEYYWWKKHGQKELKND